MLRYLTSKIKNYRREKNHDAVKEIYRRGASTVPVSTLAVHQDAAPETKSKILRAAQARRDQRGQRAIAKASTASKRSRNA